jgi:predicted DNA-binding transcriptional regulator AlpA
MTQDEHPSASQGASTTRCLTVTEIMAIYQISRCTAYAQAASYRRRGPGHGIPCVKIGNSVRFPSAWIEDHIGHQVMAQSLVDSRGSSAHRPPSYGSHPANTGSTLDARERDVPAPTSTRRR